jgi:hypothetical protein
MNEPDKSNIEGSDGSEKSRESSKSPPG